MRVFWITAAILLAGSARAGAQSANPAAPFGVPPVDDQQIYIHGIFDQLEWRAGDTSALRWEGEAWAGTDTDRLWLRSEGQTARDGKLGDGQQEIFYDRPITPYFDAQIGARYDLDSRPGRGWAAFGIEGLAPYLLHVAATLYVGGEGRQAAKLEAFRDIVITQHLVLQPQAELNANTRDDPAREIGAGISDIDAGLRLRYDITRKFAPYIGATYARSFGRTSRYARQDGDGKEDARFTVGIRTWF
jgi:copper resistance protein B